MNMSDLNIDCGAGEQLYKFGLSPRWLATEGVLEYCQENKCMWIFDVITSYIPKLTRLWVKGYVDYMLVITVKLNKTNKSSATFKISHEVEGDMVTLITQKIEYTTLPENVEFWAINSSSNQSYHPAKSTTLMLPSEY